MCVFASLTWGGSFGLTLEMVLLRTVLGIFRDVYRLRFGFPSIDGGSIQYVRYDGKRAPQSDVDDGTFVISRLHLPTGRWDACYLVSCPYCTRIIILRFFSFQAKIFSSWLFRFRFCLPVVVHRHYIHECDPDKSALWAPGGRRAS